MRVVVGILSVALIALMLAEFFTIFLLPRRVKRDPRIALAWRFRVGYRARTRSITGASRARTATAIYA